MSNSGGVEKESVLSVYTGNLCSYEGQCYAICRKIHITINYHIRGIIWSQEKTAYVFCHLKFLGFYRQQHPVWDQHHPSLLFVGTVQSVTLLRGELGELWTEATNLTQFHSLQYP